MFSKSSWILFVASCCPILSFSTPVRLSERSDGSSTCQRTTVAVLGGGGAGTFAAQALHNASVDDFVLIEYNGELGGRVKHTTFGAEGHEYVVELGANWVQGLVSEGGPENPIWTLAKKWNLDNKYSNYANMSTFDETGEVDYYHLNGRFEESYTIYEQAAGTILTQNLQDRSARVGFNLANWKPNKRNHWEVIEWFLMDWEYASTPETTSHEFSVTNYNTTFYQWSEENNFVFDPRGYSTIISGEASTFMAENDPRLMLNTIVTDIEYSDSDVTIHTDDGSCIQADYAICTFSVGVLQHDDVKFQPPLPEWKRMGIEGMTMATYSKIFLQFPPDQVFWDTSTQFFLYADPHERGYYPAWQSFEAPGFVEGSGIFFVTVVQDQSFQAEAQSDELTQSQVMEVLYTMFGKENVPDPIAFLFPRWSLEPWSYGSYSNWPPGYTVEMHQNLRANVGRLWFAGEATSAEYYGFLHGAYYEGTRAGTAIAKCINGNQSACDSNANYPVLHGTTREAEFDPENGWMTSTFLTYGL